MHLVAPWSHRTSLPDAPRSAGLAREFVCGRLVEHGLHNLVDDLRVVVNELATNAIVHARTPFAVTLRGDQGWVLLQVRDGSTAPAVLLDTPRLKTSGRGLAIVAQLGDRWGTNPHSDGGKSVWVRFDSWPARPERASTE